MISRLKYFVLLLFLPGFTILFAQGVDGYDQQHLEVSLRMVGHQVLLEAGDSTSRVLPVAREDQRYRLRFGTELEVNPDVLVQIVDEVMRDTENPERYILEVVTCDSGNVVHAFEKKGSREGDLAPCKSRVLPRDCYELFYTPHPGRGDFIAFPYPITVPGEDADEIEIAGSNRGWLWRGLPFLFLLIAATAGGYFFLRKKRTHPNAGTKGHVLGNFTFDPLRGELQLGRDTIALSGKESDLLQLLFNSVNETVEREIILNRVWGDDGDYVGRTLDVFISKLRKKLEADPDVRIVNIRGVGYKLLAEARVEN